MMIMKTFMKWTVPAVLAAFSAVSCSGDRGLDAAAAAEQFVRGCLDMDRDAMCSVCSDARADSLEGAFSGLAAADTASLNMLRTRLSCLEIQSCSQERISADSVCVTVRFGDSLSVYGSRLLVVRTDEGWKVEDVLAYDEGK